MASLVANIGEVFIMWGSIYHYHVIILDLGWVQWTYWNLAPFNITLLIKQDIELASQVANIGEVFITGVYILATYPTPGGVEESPTSQKCGNFQPSKIYAIIYRKLNFK